MSAQSKSKISISMILVVVGAIVLGIVLPYIFPISEWFDPQPQITEAPPPTEVPPTDIPEVIPTEDVPTDPPVDNPTDAPVDVVTDPPGTNPTMPPMNFATPTAPPAGARTPEPAPASLPVDAWNRESSTINMRQAGNATAHLIVAIPVGAKLQVLTYGEWAQVTYNNQNGFVRSDLLTFTNPGGAAAETYAWVKVSEGTLSLRETASATATVKASMPNAAKVKVLEWATGAAWAKVEYNGTVGYCSTQFITTTQP